jgi:hypothetical protein
MDNPNLSDIKTKILQSLKKPKTESNTKSKEPDFFSLADLFDIFGSLNDYDIHLFLFDYSCSAFYSDIKDHQNYNEIMKNINIAKGGNKYQTIRRKMKTKKSTIRKKRNTKKRHM